MPRDAADEFDERAHRIEVILLAHLPEVDGEQNEVGIVEEHVDLDVSETTTSENYAQSGRPDTKRASQA